MLSWTSGVVWAVQFAPQLGNLEAAFCSCANMSTSSVALTASLCARPLAAVAAHAGQQHMLHVRAAIGVVQCAHQPGHLQGCSGRVAASSLTTCQRFPTAARCKNAASLIRCGCVVAACSKHAASSLVHCCLTCTAPLQASSRPEGTHRRLDLLL